MGTSLRSVVNVRLGLITDSAGAVVAGADVTITNVDTGLKKTMLTDSGGNFEILALPEGPYSVSVAFTIQNLDLAENRING